MRDMRKLKALGRAEAIYARHQQRADQLGVHVAIGPAHAMQQLETQLIEAIAIAIYDAAVTGQP